MAGYIDYSYPTWLVNEVKKQKQEDVVSDSWWLSQPRKDTDGLTEALVITFQSLVSISELSFDLLQVGCIWELWYRNRNNDLQRVWDPSAQHLAGRINHSKRQFFQWGKYTRRIHPIVARGIELRLRRIPADMNYGITEPYSVGVREFYAKRNIFDRDEATKPFEDEVDLLGNLVSKTIVDWDPKKATDDEDFTFWKSGPQASPDAVVNYYIDCRLTDTSPVTYTNLATNPSFENFSPEHEAGINVALSPIPTLNGGWQPAIAEVVCNLDYDVVRRSDSVSLRVNNSVASQTNGSVDGIGAMTVDNSGSGVIEVSELTNYTISLWTRFHSELITNAYLEVNWSDNAGVSVGQDTILPDELIFGNWNEIRGTLASPANASYCRIVFQSGSEEELLEETPIWIQDICVGTESTEYFDGSHAPDKHTSVWTGTENESTSVLTALASVEGFSGKTSDEWSMSGNRSLLVETEESIVIEQDQTLLITARSIGQEVSLGTVLHTKTTKSNQQIKIHSESAATVTLGAGHWDNLLIVDGNYEGDYFDGDTEGASWSGEAHNSVSSFESIEQRELPQSITSVYLDPVYTGQDVNIYFSNDDHTGRGKLSNLTLSPTTYLNAMWKKNQGITLSQSDSNLTYNLATSGFEPKKDWWFAFEFSTRWDSENPVSYDIASFEGFKLQTSGGHFSLFDHDFPENTKFVVAFSNGRRKEVRLYRDGVLVGREIVATLPQSSHLLRFGRGIRLHAMALQQGQSGEEFENSLWQFAQDTEEFLSPSDIFGGNTLNDIIFGGDIRITEHPRGGLESNYFEEKTWVPVWKDYTVRKGKLVLPRPVLAKYLKLEFSNLTEQPYPIWESGIETQYKTFPISVRESLRTVSTTQTTTTTTQTSRSDQNTVQTRTTSFTTSPKTSSTYDVQVVADRYGTISNVLNTYDKPISSSFVKEVSDSTLYKRTTQSTRTLSKDKYYTVVSGDWLIKIGKKLDLPWKEIYNANKSLIDNDPRVKLLPKRSPGWWIFPGQKLKISSKIMEMITTSEVKTERKETTLARKRFETTMIHRYDIQTVTRDAAIAYFAGLREIKLFTTNYITNEDSNYVVYDMSKYFTVIEGEVQIDDELGVHPVESPVVMESEIFPSLSPFRRLSINTFDRGLQRPFSNLSSMTQVGDAEWQSDYVFDGEATIRVAKAESETSTESGLKSPNFHLPDSTRWRIGGRIYRVRNTDSKFAVRIKDNEDNIIFEQSVEINPGGWVSFATNFQSFIEYYEDASLEFMSVGTEEEVFYVESLYLDTTTTTWEGSNDGGRTYYDITDAIYPQSNLGYMQFPNVDNQLRFRVTMREDTDFVYGFEANPKYEADSPPRTFSFTDDPVPITFRMSEYIYDSGGAPVSFSSLETEAPDWTVKHMREGLEPGDI